MWGEGTNCPSRYSSSDEGYCDNTWGGGTSIETQQVSRTNTGHTLRTLWFTVHGYQHGSFTLNWRMGSSCEQVLQYL